MLTQSEDNKKFSKDEIMRCFSNLEERLVDGMLINYSINENNNIINIFFDKKTFDLIGWQNTDLYQNFNITFLSSIRKNRIISKDLFKIPSQN